MGKTPYQLFFFLLYGHYFWAGGVAYIEGGRVCGLRRYDKNSINDFKVSLEGLISEFHRVPCPLVLSPTHAVSLAPDNFGDPCRAGFREDY